MSRRPQRVRRKPRARPKPAPKTLFSVRNEARRMSLLLLRIPNDDDLFNVDVSRHTVFFQVKDVAFDLGRFTAYRNPLATNLDFFAQAVLKKISHSHYSSVNWVSTRLRFYHIVLPMRNLMTA